MATFTPDAVPPSVTTQLAPGETIRWTSRPDPLTSAVGGLPSALFGGIFMIIPLILLTRHTDVLFAVRTLVLLVFLTIGLLLFAAPLRAWRAALRTRYVITDRRLLIAVAGGRALTSLKLRAIGQVDRRDWKGLTTLRIPMALVSDGDDGQDVKYLELEGIPDGDVAYRLLTQQAA